MTSLSYGTRPKHKLVDARVRVPCGRLGLSMNERHEVRYIWRILIRTIRMIWHVINSPPQLAMISVFHESLDSNLFLVPYVGFGAELPDSMQTNRIYYHNVVFSSYTTYPTFHNRMDVSWSADQST
jgi:hypothetical protein